MKSIIYSLVIFFSIFITANAYSQSHFEIQDSAKDISAQRDLFKNANVESAIITGMYFDEKISFDRDGRILSRLSYASGDESAFDGKKIYEYDNSGNLVLIKFEGGDYTEPLKLFYDEYGNLNSMTGGESYGTVESNEQPKEYVKYENGMIIEIKFKCWDEGPYAPFTYSKTKYSYDLEKRISSISYINGNCKTGTEHVEFQTTIEYDDKNLPIKYITTNNSGDKEISIIIYKYFN